MTTHIALFRAINVMGNNILPMKDLKAILEKLGAEKVKTYIQSGNVIFDHAESDTTLLAEKISSSVKKSHGFEPHVLLLDKKFFEKAASSNPFPQADSAPKSLHLFFLESIPENPDFKKMDELKTDTEQYKLIGNVYYFYAPDGFGRSKLAAKAEKLLGVPSTARNWNTVIKILKLAY